MRPAFSAAFGVAHIIVIPLFPEAGMGKHFSPEGHDCKLYFPLTHVPIFPLTQPPFWNGS